MLNGETLQFPISACSSISNFLISPGHLWLRFCLSWFISVTEFGKNKLQGDSASGSTVNSEAVPLGRYVEQRLSNTSLNLHNVRTHCECHTANKKEPKEGRVHLHLKHQQPWNQCLKKWRLETLLSGGWSFSRGNGLETELPCLFTCHSQQSNQGDAVSVSVRSSLPSQSFPGCAPHTQ